MRRGLVYDLKSSDSVIHDHAVVTHDLITGFRDVANFIEAAYNNNADLYVNWTDIREYINYVMDECAKSAEWDRTFESRAIEYAKEQGYEKVQP